MNWIDIVKQRLKRKNQILFSADDELLQELSILVGEQNHRVLSLWAFELAEEAVNRLEEKLPGESRPRIALETSRLWAAGSG